VQFHRGVLLAHWCSSPCSLWQEDSSIAILPKPAEVIFEHRLREDPAKNLTLIRDFLFASSKVR
jgi:hypothetical protein